MAHLHRVCCIMDLDGFDIRVPTDDGASYRTKFLTRELGYIRIDPEVEYRAISFRFDLRKEIDMSKMPADVCRTLKYQSEKVIGLPVLPARNEVTKDYGEFESVVRDMYRTCQQPGKDIVAYKGGSKEKVLLDSMGIPSLDLGLYGCKTYVNLVKERNVRNPFPDCGQHVGGPELVHCPRAETTAFRDWYMQNYRSFECTPDDDSSDDDW